MVGGGQALGRGVELARLGTALDPVRLRGAQKRE